VVPSQSAGTEPLSTGLKQLAEDGETGIGRQRLVMMMMMLMMVRKWLVGWLSKV